MVKGGGGGGRGRGVLCKMMNHLNKTHWQKIKLR